MHLWKLYFGARADTTEPLLASVRSFGAGVDGVAHSSFVGVVVIGGMIALGAIIYRASQQGRAQQSQLPPKIPHHQSPARSHPASAADVSPGAGPSVLGDHAWYPAARGVRIAGYDIPGGMIYCGSGLPSPGAYGSAEAAQLDPTLPVDPRVPDRDGHTMDYYPRYAGMTPVARAAYLEWSASGRANPNYSIGYVFLFFYGIERRVLIDAGISAPAHAEIPVLLAEVERLLSVYSNNASFRGYATRFRDYVRVTHQLPSPRASKRLADESFEVPFSVAAEVGTCVAAGTPIPAVLALAWFNSHPDCRIRTPGRRCPEEFRSLFTIRYRDAHGEGLVLKASKSTLEARYQPANPGMAGMEFKQDTALPKTAMLAGPVKKVAKVADAVQNELDAYSRWLGRNPDAEDRRPGLALLPPALLASTGADEANEMKDWVSELLGGRSCTVVHGRRRRRTRAELGDPGRGPTVEEGGHGPQPDAASRWGSHRTRPAFWRPSDCPREADRYFQTERVPRHDAFGRIPSGSGRAPPGRGRRSLERSRSHVR